MKTAQKSAPQKSAASATTAKQAKPQQSDVATGLRDLFEDSLKDIYWAEKALTKALPKMIKKATSDELVSALTDHLAVTHHGKTAITRARIEVARHEQLV